jgi:hypothetical protein
LLRTATVIIIGPAPGAGGGGKYSICVEKGILMSCTIRAFFGLAPVC